MRTWAEIDLDAVRHNVRCLIAHLVPGTRFMAVVKANAYGHGAVEVARAALEAGAWALGVATTDEAVQLRRAGLQSPLVHLGPMSVEHAESVVAHDVAAAVFQLEVGRALSRAAARTGRTALVHLKVDTGMARIGVVPGEAVALAKALLALPHVHLGGCFTHFATADEEDLDAARSQLAVFRRVLEALRDAGIAPGIRHAANSAATLAMPESHLDLVRCGIAIYGLSPAPHLSGQAPLAPVMNMRARVVQVKRVPQGTPVGYGAAYRTPDATTIVTIPAGYGDGYPRLAGDGGRVLIRGQRLAIAGRVAMDQLMVDAGDLPVEVGDVAELWGTALPAEEVAAAARTISYEIVTRVSARVPRIFLEGGRVRSVRTLLDENG
jgi:alanine racemase